MSAAIRFTINGKRAQVRTDAERPLLEVIREELGLTGTKYGCGEGQCRACTVLVDGKPVTSCLTPVRTVSGKSITTIEGLAPHRVQQAFVEESAMQCGYCVPGMVLRAASLLERTPRPTDAQILEAMNGSLCRCCGYPRILAAIRRAAGIDGGKA